ncbi:DUF120 domain-containing protein [Thermogladius sp. 4427co]|uniref:DUF120 domain-containing protein n=1 Tax=Thermogladius sp. 4427co TaxID=3450718 RepID=UPI003F7A1C5B
MISVRGRVVSGSGLGAFYVELYRSLFIKYLEIDPFPGTLNIEVLDYPILEKALALLDPIIIPPPREGYGNVLVYRALLERIPVYIVRPEKTQHPPRIVEVVSERYLRKTLNLRDGDIVVLTLAV